MPIKDIKTFIRAMRRVVNLMPEAEGWIAGPEDEDPGYAEECRNLTESLGLSDKVKFLGFQRIDEILPKVGALILSSISEARLFNRLPQPCRRRHPTPAFPADPPHSIARSFGEWA